MQDKYRPVDFDELFSPIQEIGDEMFVKETCLNILATIVRENAVVQVGISRQLPIRLTTALSTNAQAAGNEIVETPFRVSVLFADKPRDAKDEIQWGYTHEFVEQMRNGFQEAARNNRRIANPYPNLPREHLTINNLLLVTASFLQFPVGVLEPLSSISPRILQELPDIMENSHLQAGFTTRAIEYIMDFGEARFRIARMNGDFGVGTQEGRLNVLRTFMGTNKI